MRRFKCLYRYSQEALVEAFNTVIKLFFFRRTQRGGANGPGSSNRVLGIGKWVQRRLYWFYQAYLGHQPSEVVEDEEEAEQRDDSLLYTEDDADLDCLFYDELDPMVNTNSEMEDELMYNSVIADDNAGEEEDNNLHMTST